MGGVLDTAAKTLMHLEPGSILRLLLPGLRIVGHVAVDTELPAQARRMDKLYRLEVEGQSSPAPLHIEVVANWASTVPASTFDYWSRAEPSHPGLGSVVLVLKRGDRQGPPTNRFTRDDAFGRRVLDFGYELVCAWDLTVEELRQAGAGALLLVPFARDGSEAHVEAALRTLDAVQPPEVRAELMGALVVTASNVFPDVRWIEKIPKEILMASQTIKELLDELTEIRLAQRVAEKVAELQAAARAQGHAQGHAQGARRLLEVALCERLEGAEGLVTRLPDARLDEAAKLLARPLDSDSLRAALEQLILQA